MAHKPAGLPLTGLKPNTLEKLLPAALQVCLGRGKGSESNTHSNAGVQELIEVTLVTAPPRPMAGPVLLRLGYKPEPFGIAQNTEGTQTGVPRIQFYHNACKDIPVDVHLHHYAILHGAPPLLSQPPNALPSPIVSYAVQRTVQTTTGMVSAVLLRTHGGYADGGMRKALCSWGYQVVGSAAGCKRLKSSATRGMLLCTYNINVPSLGINASAPVPRKFNVFLDREERFGMRVKNVSREKGEEEFGDGKFLYEGCMRPRRGSLVVTSAAAAMLKTVHDRLLVSDSDAAARGVEFLDVGCGSGNLLVTVLKKCGFPCFATGIDVSEHCLETTLANARRHEVETHVNVVRCDMHNDDIPRTLQEGNLAVEYDAIIANPPYLTRREIKRDAHGLGVEPELAIWGGEDGMQGYHGVARVASMCLRNKGVVVVEVGKMRSVPDVVDIFETFCGKVASAEVDRDQWDFARSLVIRFE